MENHLNRQGAVLTSRNMELDNFSIADVVGFSGEYINRNIIIDKGIWHGIRTGAPVLGSAGIVGKITSTGPKHSIIMPFNHT
ncbi:MAG: hypothetical protein K8S56_03720 [Candidatus Cloacimonetes bacterium]|nr:hypothetical protein [Candidatus Cloacimonadota bacterium]